MLTTNSFFVQNPEPERQHVHGEGSPGHGDHTQAVEQPGDTQPRRLFAQGTKPIIL